MDSGERWRLRFKSKDVTRVLPLFRRQIIATGDATYFVIKSPRLDVEDFRFDEPRDYIAAFEILSKAGEAIFGDAPVQDLLTELHG